jgi:DNA repair exonuclease SbcCD ATPase subunit
MHKPLLAVSAVAIVLLVVLSYLTGRGIDHEEILRAKLEMARLKASRDSLKAAVAYKDSMQKQLQLQVASKEAETERLRANVDLLEEKRQEDQLSVRKIRSSDALVAKMEKTYPPIKSFVGVTKVVSDNGFEDDYLLVPLWFGETFIAEHQNALSYEAQRDSLLILDSLQQEIKGLNAKVFELEKEKSEAYRSHYEEVYVKYDSLNTLYTGLLAKPPQVKFGVPQISAIAVGAAAGLVGGVLISQGK